MTQVTIDFTRTQSPERFTPTESRIMGLIQKGRSNAISMPVLASAVNISTRELQSTIQHLINDCGVLIASSCGKPSGYYYPESVDDYRAGSKQIANRIIQLAKRLRKMDKETYEAIFGQMRLYEKV